MSFERIIRSLLFLARFLPSQHTQRPPMQTESLFLVARAMMHGRDSVHGPHAAVVDLVLGIATLSIIGRSQGQPSTNRVIGCILGWILIFLGLSYLMTAVLEFRYGAQAEFSSLDLTKVSGTFAYTAKNLLLSSAVVLMALLPFFFPFRVVQKEWDVWFLIVFSCSAAALFTSLHLLTDFRHFNIEFFLHTHGLNCDVPPLHRYRGPRRRSLTKNFNGRRPSPDRYSR